MPRWFTEGGGDRSQWYVDRFKRLAAEGVDLAGEARLIDALVAPGSHILDAGCGSGRVGAELADAATSSSGSTSTRFWSRLPNPNIRVRDGWLQTSSTST